MYMGYSDEYIKEPTTDVTQIDGFTIDSQGNIDVENSKLTNIKPGTDDTDALTKKQVYNHIKANLGDGSTPVDLADYLKKDGSIAMTADLSMGDIKKVNLGLPENNKDAVNKGYLTTSLSNIANVNDVFIIDGTSLMKGHLIMDFNRVRSIGNPRSGFSDAIPYIYFTNWYFNLDSEQNKILAQSQIDMKDKKITRLKEPLHHKDAATKFYIDNSTVLKADISYVDNEISRNLGTINLTSYLKSDGSIKMISDLDLNNNFIDNLKTAQFGHEAVNFI